MSPKQVHLRSIYYLLCLEIEPVCSNSSVNLTRLAILALTTVGVPEGTVDVVVVPVLSGVGPADLDVGIVFGVIK